jgi:hypothetical protein
VDEPDWWQQCLVEGHTLYKIRGHTTVDSLTGRKADQRECWYLPNDLYYRTSHALHKIGGYTIAFNSMYKTNKNIILHYRHWLSTRHKRIRIEDISARRTNRHCVTQIRTTHPTYLTSLSRQLSPPPSSYFPQLSSRSPRPFHPNTQVPAINYLPKMVFLTRRNHFKEGWGYDFLGGWG